VKNLKSKNQKNSKTYEVLIIGGGISACVFISNYLKKDLRKNIALIEAGRGLGGRSSTRISKKFKGWKIDHGSPNLNICNKSDNLLLQDFIDELLKNNFIKIDDSDYIEINDNGFKSVCIENSEFRDGTNYFSDSSMSELSENIISLNQLRNQIDYYFETLIVKLEFTKKVWYLTSNKGEIFKSKYIILSSNLLLHKRSIEILNTKEIPLRKAVPKNNNKSIDSIINFLEKQSYISRLTFLIYTKADYKYKDSYEKKNRYFHLHMDLENRYEIERIIFQRQKNNKLAIVIHTKSKSFIDDYIKGENEDIFKNKILTRFNDLFHKSSSINQLFNYDKISIMRWRASQPSGLAVPKSVQFISEYRIGFCGDWFSEDGFGRIEGAILSALRLVNIFRF